MELVKIVNFIGLHFSQYLYLILFILIFVEEMGIPLPVPGDVYLFLAGYQVYKGHANPILLIIDIVIATIMGSSILFFVVTKKGEPIVRKYGKYFLLSPKHLEKGKSWFSRYGEFAVIVGRGIPGLRIVSTIVAGIFKLEYYKFFYSIIIAAIIWACFFMYLGIAFGNHTTRFLNLFGNFDKFGLYASIAGAAVILFIIGYSFYNSMKTEDSDITEPAQVLDSPEK